MGAPVKVSDAAPLTALMVKAVSHLSTLPAERQNELAQMLIDVAESDRLLASGELALTPEQWAEVDKALEEDGPYVSEEEMEAFFAQYRT